MPTKPQQTNKEITDAIVDKAMAKVRDRKPPTEPQQTDIVSEARAVLTKCAPTGKITNGADAYLFDMKAPELLRQLCDEVERLRAELGQRERTMKCWEESYLAEHEHWGNCQWKIENTALREQLAEAREYGDKLARNYTSLEDWILRIRIKLGLRAKDADVEGAISELQSRLAQVEKERDELRQTLSALEDHVYKP